MPDDRGAATPPGQAGRRRGLLVSLVVIAGIALSVLVYQALAGQERRYAAEQFRREAQERVTAVQHEFSKSTEALIALEAFYAATREVGRDRFALFTKPLLAAYPFLLSVEWTPRVSAADRPEFERALGAYGGQAGPIMRVDNHGALVPTDELAEGEEYFPVLFTEPLESNRVALGYDHGSDPQRLRVMHRARDTGHMIASERISLFRVSADRRERRHHIILFLPIYRTGAPRQTVEQRRTNLEGFVTSVVLIDGLIQQAAMAQPWADGLQFHLYDTTDGSDPAPIYAPRRGRRSDGPMALSAVVSRAPGGVYHERRFELADKSYSAVVLPTHGYLAGKTTRWPEATLGVGFAAAALAGVFVHRVSSESARVAQLVVERTDELTDVNHALRRLAEEHRIAEEAANDRASELRARSKMILSVTQDLEAERAKLRSENEERRTAERRLEAVLDASDRVAIIATDLDGTVRVFNSGAQRLIGYTAEEVVGRESPMLWHDPVEVSHRGRDLSESLGRTVQGFDVLVARARHGAYDELEWQFVHRDGTRRTVLLNVTAVRLGGQLQGFLAAGVDVTERKREQERFESVVAASPTALMMVDHSGAIVLVNDQMERVFGYRRAELLGMNVDALVPQRFRGSHEAYRRGFFVNPEARAMGSGRDLYALRKDGSEFPVEIALNPIDTADGPAVLSAVVDITERKQAEDRLNRYAADLERSNAELDQFAYVASHDLKAPLRGLDSLAQWIVEDLGDSVPQATKEHLLKMHQRVERMEALLDDLLAYSRAGRVFGDAETINLTDLIGGITQMISPPDGMSVVAAGRLPILRAYRAPLELVLRNLIQNAVKHHDRDTGCVEISAEERDEWVELAVSDDGPGIESKYHDRVFGMFKTLRPRDQVEGSGMGLAVVRKTIESQGGKVWLESEGRGACFRFTWPKSAQV